MQAKTDLRIFIAGHKGLVGSAVLRLFQKMKLPHLLVKTKSELDLRDLRATEKYFEAVRPEVVILAAARVGGIGANTKFPVEFLLENLQIQNNVISSAANFGVKKLVFLGSSCIYPRNAMQPMTEDQLLTGPFEPTNEPYALAKVTGIKLCEAYRKEFGKNFISVMPTNLYGPNDYYDLHNSHVIPAMLLKVLRARNEAARKVTLWGSGNVFREFLHSDDVAAAIAVCLEKYDDAALINIGSGVELKVAELAEVVCRVCGFKGSVEWDTTMPDGAPQKHLDVSKMRNLGWQPTINLEEGLISILPEAEKAIQKISKNLAASIC